MKEISIFFPRDDLARVSEVLKKHNVGGITFYEINGAGRTIVPDYAKRTKVETTVSDSAVNQIVDDISNSLSQQAGGEAHGMIFIKDVSDAYELGTKQRGEAVLTSK